MGSSVDALGVGAALVVAALPFFACVPGLSAVRCAAPFATGVVSLSALVENRPILPVFTTAAATWTLCTAWRARADGRPRAAGATLVVGLLFCCVPLGASEAAWVTHCALLSLDVLAVGGAVAARARSGCRAWAHAVGSLASLALAALFLVLGNAAPDWAPPAARAMGVAAGEVAAALHVAAMQAHAASARTQKHLHQHTNGQ